MSAIVTLENITVVLDDKTIISDVDFSLMPGEILGLVGPSGCGKTTLLNTIAGFIKPQQGLIHLSHTLVASDDVFIQPEHRQVGVIFQDYALFPHLTVKQNIAFGIQSLARDEQASRIEQLLSLLKIEALGDRLPHQLSGGQQQRVAIARALAPQTKLLLLDEPFSNIDARLRNELMLELRRLLKQLGVTAIFVTHNKDEVFTFADKVAVLHQGKILQFGEPASVCQQPTSWQVADFLQLGSWLPIEKQAAAYASILGDVPLEGGELTTGQLLVKPIDIIVSNGQANCEVTHINITEHGYQYIVASLNQQSPLAFQQLHFYSQSLYQLEEKLALSIKPHRYIAFECSVQ